MNKNFDHEERLRRNAFLNEIKELVEKQVESYPFNIWNYIFEDEEIKRMKAPKTLYDG